MSGKTQERNMDSEFVDAGHGDGPDDDLAAPEVDVEADYDIKLADLDTKNFKQVPLWEAPEGPMYDDRDAGPTNLPSGHENFTPLQIVLLFFTPTLLEVIVVQTNLYYLQSQPNNAKLDPLLTLCELTTWIGLHMMMVSQWSKSQDSYWNGTGGFDASVYMTRGRFYWIKKYLHFNDTEVMPSPDSPDWDPLYRIRPLVDTVNAMFSKYWKLSAYVSLDEMMIAFKGHNPFHCYIPRKPNPNGTKMHAICDAIHFFCVQLLVDDKTTRTIVSIATILFMNNVMPGMTVITDRYYTCTALVRYCLALGVGFIGSTMTQRFLAKHVFVGWSKDEAEHKPRGTFKVATSACDRVANIIWKDKGVVRLTCTAGASVRCRLVRRARGQSSFLVGAPQVAKLFDQYFHGVDRNDQLRGSNYGLALHFRAKKYTIKMFLGILDIVLSNSFIMWRILHPKDRKKHRVWFKRVAEELVAYNPNGDPVYCKESSSGYRDVHALMPFQYGKARTSTKRLERKQADCPMCSTSLKRKRSSCGCVTCNVALHPGACTIAWHSLTPEDRKRKKPRHRKLYFDMDFSDLESMTTLTTSTSKTPHSQ